jgi:thiol:disulfide interchange protein DsbA
MKRREFAAVAAAVSVGAFGILNPSMALAQTEGKEYVKIEPSVPTSPGVGKVQVIEFFGYWCPHCHHFDPTLEAWLKKAPANVTFTRVPVAFSPLHRTLQSLYYALESSGQLTKLHPKVFEWVHEKKMKMASDSDVIEFMSANGASMEDAKKMVGLMYSFQVVTKASQAKKLADAYKLEGIPSLAVGGMFVTSPSQAGGEAQAIKVMESLLSKVSPAK